MSDILGRSCKIPIIVGQYSEVRKIQYSDVGRMVRDIWNGDTRESTFVMANKLIQRELREHLSHE